MVKDIKLGTTQVQKAYVGNSLVFEYVPPDVTAPITSIRPDPTLKYNTAITVYLDVNEPSDTYYTTDGSTPTTASTKYTGGFQITSSATIKYFSVDRSGNAEPVQTTTYTLDTTAPVTTPSVAGGTYTNTFSVTLSVNEPSTTYYTTNGTTPTTASTKYTGAIPINSSTTLKYFSVDAVGNTESVKTTTYTLNLKTMYRYVRFIGHGDQTSLATTRLVELRAFADGVNRLAGRVPISGETPNAGSGVAGATDGDISMASGTYPIWWTGAGIPTLTYDLGASYGLDEIHVWMFSTTNDPRQTKFIIQASPNNSTWTTIANWSTNTSVQPSTGWKFNAQTRTLI